MMLLKDWTKSVYFPRSVVLAALALIGTVAVYNWVVAPHTNYLLAAQRYKAVAGELAKTNRIISSNVAVKKKELEDIQSQFKQVCTGLFDSAGEREFFGNIQSISEQSGCVVSSFKFLSARSRRGAVQSGAGDITQKHAALSIAGRYKNIVLLMNKLQNRAERVRIDSVSIRPAGGRSGYLVCDITVTVYVMPNKEMCSYD